MKKLVYILLFLINYYTVAAQHDEVNKSIGVSGNIYRAVDFDITCCLFRQPVKGYIKRSKDSIEYYSDLNFDFFENKLFYFRKKTIVFIKGPVVEFGVDTTQNNFAPTIFRYGFIDSLNDKKGKKFYEVLNDRNIKLLKFYNAQENTNNPLGLVKQGHEFIVNTLYYLYKDNKLYALDRNTRSSFCATINAINAKLAEAIVRQDLDTSNEEVIMAIVETLNNLIDKAR